MVTFRVIKGKIFFLIYLFNNNNNKKIKGLEALKEHFKNSKFPCEMDHYLPVVFSPPRDGGQLTEPLPIVGQKQTVPIGLTLHEEDHDRDREDQHDEILDGQDDHDDQEVVLENDNDVFDGSNENFYNGDDFVLGDQCYGQLLLMCHDNISSGCSSKTLNGGVVSVVNNDDDDDADADDQDSRQRYICV